MALDLKIEVTERAANCSGFTVEDITGTYDAINNPTGYGTPNAERDDYKAVLVANRVNSNGATAIATTAVGAVPAQWQVPTLKDGYYDIMLVLATDFNLFSSYQKNQVRLYNGSLYVSDTAVGMHKSWLPQEVDAVLQVAGIYEPETLTGEIVLSHIGNSGLDIMEALVELGVPSSSLNLMPAHIAAAGLDEEPVNGWTKIVTTSQYPLLALNTGAYYDRIPQLAYCHTDKCKLNRDTAFAATDCSNCSTDDTGMIAYYQVERAYKGAIYNFGLGNYVKAGDQIEMAENICNEKVGGCGCN